MDKHDEKTPPRDVTEELLAEPAAAPPGDSDDQNLRQHTTGQDRDIDPPVDEETLKTAQQALEALGEPVMVSASALAQAMLDTAMVGAEDAIRLTLHAWPRLSAWSDRTNRVMAGFGLPPVHEAAQRLTAAGYPGVTPPVLEQALEPAVTFWLEVTGTGDTPEEVIASAYATARQDFAVTADLRPHYPPTIERTPIGPPPEAQLSLAEQVAVASGKKLYAEVALAGYAEQPPAGPLDEEGVLTQAIDLVLKLRHPQYLGHVPSDDYLALVNDTVTGLKVTRKVVRRFNREKGASGGPDSFLA